MLAVENVCFQSKYSFSIVKHKLHCKVYDNYSLRPKTIIKKRKTDNYGLTVSDTLIKTYN